MAKYLIIVFSISMNYYSRVLFRSHVQLHNHILIQVQMHQVLGLIQLLRDGCQTVITDVQALQVSRSVEELVGNLVDLTGSHPQNLEVILM